MKPRGDCDTDELWMPEQYGGGRMSMDIISEGQKGPLGFDLSRKKRKRREKSKNNT